ncbi:transcriptional regulator NodD2 [Alteraurantiacibacter aestuarii]|uniref:LysR family transcriptional regulator n=1 Tax=Alteraurantiacibacter aestuarii TaxID=650004 RepID=A0A844ZNM0_9SPHN|nr:LysR family transcriptional regulator [Alteraurantiacibacter aestuarii]MXO87239.1 LysR family transcriptional regulator [Alteraurantiacibacter aestuarii]
MRFDNFDLNLLVALDALLDHRSVTRAAAQLNVTQSAMSSSLKRLRLALGDELLVQSGRGMVPTAGAEQLAPLVREQLLRIRSLISSATAFDPATSTRRFRLAASDYISTVLLVPAQRRLAQLAPGVGLEIAMPTTGTSERLGKGEFDLLLTPREFAAKGHPYDRIFEERQVVVGCSTNPLLQGPVTLEAFTDAGHVAVRFDGRNTFIENALEELGLSVRIEVIAPSFVQVPYFLPGTRRLALMHERLAHQMAQILPLAIAESPVAVPLMQEVAQYHSARSGDAGLAWLRGLIQQVVRELEDV